MPFNSSPCFYICYGTTRPKEKDIHIFHLCTPSWFGRLVPKNGGIEIQVIKFMGPEPNKDLLQSSLDDAGLFVRAYFEKKI